MNIGEPDFSYTCRCCTQCDFDKSQNSLNLQSLYDMPPDDAFGGAMSIAEIYAATIPQTIVSPTDGLPKVICQCCLNKLLDLNKFQAMCLESAKKLRCIIQDVLNVDDEMYEEQTEDTSVVQEMYEDVDIFKPAEEEEEAIDTSISYLASTSTTMKATKNRIKKKRKVVRQPEKWKQNVNKQKRNSGKQYESHATSRKLIPERQMKGPCDASCRLKCFNKFSELERKEIFAAYWKLGDIQKQREFINNCMQVVAPTYRYVRIGRVMGPRQKNNAFYFKQGENAVRVCKLFFRNTLDINDRPIRTVLEKRGKCANQILEQDQRGKHGKHGKLDASLKAGVIQFLDEIPKIEKHYNKCGHTSKIVVEANKTVASIYRDYVEMCKEKNEPFCTYIYFYRIFTEDCNISLENTTEKDLCEKCTTS